MINDLQDLLLYEIGRTIIIEKEFLSVIHRVVNVSKQNSLKNALKHYSSVIEDHIHQLQQFERSVATNKENKEINSARVKEVFAFIGDIQKDYSNVDAAIFNIIILDSLNKIIQVKIQSYKTLNTYASALKLDHDKKMFDVILEEEFDMSDLLMQLSGSFIHKATEHLSHLSTEEKSNDSKMDRSKDDMKDESDYHNTDTTQEIRNPGGRSGTSHRTYPNNESRGH